MAAAFVGQIVNLRRIVNPPATTVENAAQLPICPALEFAAGCPAITADSTKQTPFPPIT
jgi:hypothetical protein